jgi:hypothetical protein
MRRKLNYSTTSLKRCKIVKPIIPALKRKAKKLHLRRLSKLTEKLESFLSVEQ